MLAALQRATLVAVIVFVISPPPAAGEEARDRARELARQGRAHYEAGRFQEALDAYRAAYELAPAPGVLFNLGQCHRHLSNWSNAVTSYERYIAEAPDAPNRAAVETLIDECRARLDAEVPPSPPLEADAGPPNDGDVGGDAGPPIDATDAAPSGDETDVDAATAHEGDGGARGGDGGPVVDVVRQPVEVTTATQTTTPMQATGPAAEPGTTPPPERPRRFYRRWWFWTVVGCVVTGAAVGAVAGVMAGDADTVLPSGSLGTLDGRAWSP